MDAMTRALYLPIKDKYALTSILIAHDIDDALRMSHVIHAPPKKNLSPTRTGFRKKLKEKGRSEKTAPFFKRQDSVGFYLCTANASSMA